MRTIVLRDGTILQQCCNLHVDHFSADRNSEPLLKSVPYAMTVSWSRDVAGFLRIRLSPTFEVWRWQAVCPH